MYYNVLKYALLGFGALFIVSMVLFLTVKPKIKNNVVLSDYLGVISLFFGLYILSSFVFSIWAFWNLNFFQGIILLIFATSPFTVGKFATYNTKNLFLCVQFLLIVFNIAYGFLGFN